MVNRKSGFTLIELLIAGLIATFVVLLAGKLFVQANKGLNDNMAKFGTMTSLNLIGGNLQKYLATGDSRFFAFSGNAPGDTLLARMFVPLPGTCATMATANCSQDTAFLYINYDKTVAPAVTALCLVDAQHVLVDLHDNGYGVATQNATGFNVTAGSTISPFPTGQIPIASNTLIAVMVPPVVTLWIAQASVALFDPGYNVGSQTFADPNFTANCNPRYLQKDGVGNYLVDKLFRISVKPFILTKFTGGTTVSDPDIRTAIGTFPSRLFAANLRSIGKSFDTGGNGILSVNNCSVTNTTIDCPNSQLVYVAPGVSRVRIDESFKFALFDSLSNPLNTTSRYEVRDSTQTASNVCIAPDCLTLPLNDNSTMKVQLTASETYQSLSAVGFSLMKQDAIARLRVRTQLLNKEESFDVVFP